MDEKFLIYKIVSRYFQRYIAPIVPITKNMGFQANTGIFGVTNLIL